MIITNIYGGLGNQMFQFACGFSVAANRSSNMLLMVDHFENYGLHNGFELNRIFNLKHRVANKAELKALIGLQSSTFLRKLLSRSQASKLRHRNFIVQPYPGYWNGIVNIQDDVYLHGYWQSYKYFSDHNDDIRAAFRFSNLTHDRNIDYARVMANTNSVAVHVRRGDYVASQKNSKIYSVCGTEYYKEAIKKISSVITAPHFFFFSDDPEWTKKNLCPIVANSTLVDFNLASNSYIDMQLMSLCKNNIIANSTFSWWGAWLNENPSKVVIAPSKWYVDQRSNTDLIPSEWWII